MATLWAPSQWERNIKYIVCQKENSDVKRGISVIEDVQFEKRINQSEVKEVISFPQHLFLFSHHLKFCFGREENIGRTDQ
jgi:hypothetical protein